MFRKTGHLKLLDDLFQNKPKGLGFLKPSDTVGISFNIISRIV